MNKSDYYKLRAIWQDIATIKIQQPERCLLHYEIEQALENLVQFRAAFTTNADVAAFFKKHRLQILPVKTHDATHEDLPGYVINLVTE